MHFASPKNYFKNCFNYINHRGLLHKSQVTEELFLYLYENCHHMQKKNIKTYDVRMT